MTTLPKIRTRYGEGVGVELFITPPYLEENLQTFVATDAASGVSSFTVDNGLKFAVDQYILTGMFGGEKSEIVRAHASTTPTATALTLAAATSFAHSRGERLSFIPYNQIIIEKSTDAGASYSTLATIDIRASSPESYYNDTTGTSTSYYRAKFSNSATAAVSQVSDGIIGTGYVDGTAGQVIRDALHSAGEKIDTVITKEFLFAALQEGRLELNKMPGVERWSFRTSFGYNAGSVVPGMNTLTLPTNLRESATFKNLLGIRIGRDALPLNKVDQQALRRWYQGVARTTLNGAITTGSTSIILTESGDFDESGDIYIAAPSGASVLDIVSYTTNTEATNTLGTVTGILENHASGAVVWQGASFGRPMEYTVDAGVVTFSQPFGDDEAGEVIWLDYYKEMTAANSDGDALDEPDYGMFVPYLRYRMKKRRKPDTKRDEDDDYLAYKERRDAAVIKEYTGQDTRLHIDVPR